MIKKASKKSCITNLFEQENFGFSLREFGGRTKSPLPVLPF